jgi:hypothetical protein
MSGGGTGIKRIQFEIILQVHLYIEVKGDLDFIAD